MKVWTDQAEMYTDEHWRAECEAKARKLAEERVTARELEMQQEVAKSYNAVMGPTVRLSEEQQQHLDAMLGRANQKQVGGDHYKNMGVEPWDVVDTWPIEQRIGAYRHGALKYLMRMGSKDENVQEIKKAGHYIEKLGTVSIMGRSKGIFQTPPTNRKAEQDIDFVVALRNAFPDIVEVLRSQNKGEVK